MVRTIEFSAGSLSLDFIDSVAGRHGTPVDLIDGPGALARWIEAAGLNGSSSIDDRDVGSARSLREAAYVVLSAAIDGRAVPDQEITHLNQWAARKDFRPEYRNGAVHLVSDEPFAAALSSIAADALLLLRPENLKKLRRCKDCRMLFRDNSRPGKRVWCSSSSGCGNRAKVRRHRAKHSKETSA